MTNTEKPTVMTVGQMREANAWAGLPDHFEVHVLRMTAGQSAIFAAVPPGGAPVPGFMPMPVNTGIVEVDREQVPVYKANPARGGVCDAARDAMNELHPGIFDD